MGFNIAFLVDKAEPFYVGGYEGKVWNLARRLARVPSNDVRIFTSLSVSKTRMEDVEFIRLVPTDLSPPSTTGRSLSHGVIFGLKLTRSPFGTWTPDVLVIESIPYFHLWTMSSWISRLPATKVLLVDEVWETYSYYGWPLTTVSRRALRSCLGRGLEFADLVVTTSSVTQRTLFRVFGGGLDVHVVPDGVDSNRIAKASAGSDTIDSYDFISVGRLVAIKRHADLLAALAQIRDRIKWSGKAAIVGFGSLYKPLRRLIQKLRLEDMVDLLRDVSDDRLQSLLARSKVFVLCSEREGFSRATLEAVACGIPVIVARPTHPEVFGVSDFVRENENGLYYDVGDIRQLADRMEILMRDPELRTRLAQGAVTVRSDYDWDRIAREFDSLIRTAHSRTALAHTEE